MWRIIVTTLFYIVMVETRPMEPIDGPYWDISIPAQQLFPQRVSRRSFHQNLYNPDADYDLLIPQFSQKRALTMLSRWSPLGNIGKQRTPIRSNTNLNKERQHGQPLRWG